MPSLDSAESGKNQRVLLQATNPDGIQALIEDSKRREKSAHGDGKVWVGDVIRLQVVEILAYFAAVRPTAVRALQTLPQTPPSLPPASGRPAAPEEQG